jgi:membrane protein DedA with SNARE-associated domain
MRTPSADRRRAGRDLAWKLRPRPGESNQPWRRVARMSGLWDALNHSVRALIATHPLMVLAAVLFFEEAGVPSPIPSDFMMLLAGVRARQGDYPFWAVILVQELATLAGTTGLFLFSRRFGRALVARYGWVLHLGPETLARAEVAIAKSGGRAIVIGRLIPGLRIITPVAAAVLGTPLRTFLPAVALGAFLYILAFTLAGALVGPTALAILERVALPTGALVSLAVVFVAIFLVRRLKRELPTFARGGAGHAVAARLDGLLAGVVALLTTDGVVAERLPPPLRLALTAGVPLALTLLLALALAGRHLARLAEGGGQVLVAIEGLRWLAFGVALGEFLPLDAELHRVSRAGP